MTDLSPKQMKMRVVALAAQIKHLREKAASTEFPAERDSAIRIADKQTLKMVAIQAEIDRLPATVKKAGRDPIAVLSDVQCHALLLAERGFPRVWKYQVPKRTWSSLVRKKLVAFPKGRDQIVATEKGKAFLMALRKEYRADMCALRFPQPPSGICFYVSPAQWALRSVLQREMDRLQKYQPRLGQGTRILPVPRVPS